MVQTAVGKAFEKGVDLPLPDAVLAELPLFKTDVDKSILAGLITSHNSLSEKEFSTKMFRPEKDFGWNKVVVDGFDQIVDGYVLGTSTLSFWQVLICNWYTGTFLDYILLHVLTAEVDLIKFFSYTVSNYSMNHML